ncbi:hypothetical protein POM88_043082 [Heracleum sosnowskyi]|uniref:Uncharacterized protein n=1 Tax=Heracleum sosnowskyi TaxID=360622 RepID=A0AAD8M445_9APIA|nr:hypothetical protein POM88_043082 [Heracleum sosnowskyi]
MDLDKEASAVNYYSNMTGYRGGSLLLSWNLNLITEPQQSLMQILAACLSSLANILTVKVTDSCKISYGGILSELIKSWPLGLPGKEKEEHIELVFPTHPMSRFPLLLRSVQYSGLPSVISIFFWARIGSFPLHPGLMKMDQYPKSGTDILLLTR